MTERMQVADLERALDGHGMLLRGWFAPDAADSVPEAAPGRPARTLLLVGNAGPEMYRHFFAAGTMAGQADPLNTWTRRVIEPIAARFGANAVFPFSGPPWLPFQRWAMRAEGLKASPLGILIHPALGLWHAYRAALLFEQVLDLQPTAKGEHPCARCADQPCRTACPVGAVTTAGYDTGRCAAHVASPAGVACRDFGCLARRACPVGADRQYPPAAMAFHMAAFLKGHRPDH